MSRIWGTDGDALSNGQDQVLQNQDRTNSLRSDFSGSGRPSETVAHQRWVDSSLKKNFRVNATNDADVEIGSFEHLDDAGTATTNEGHQRALWQTIGDSGASKTIDWSEASEQHLVLTAATVTLAFTSPANLGEKMTLYVKQDTSGSRAISWPASVRWSGGTAPTLTSTASKTDIIQFIYNPVDAKYEGFVVSQNH
jgi:hypothetical protein